MVLTLNVRMYENMATNRLSEKRFNFEPVYDDLLKKNYRQFQRQYPCSVEMSSSYPLICLRNKPSKRGMAHHRYQLCSRK